MNNQNFTESDLKDVLEKAIKKWKSEPLRQGKRRFRNKSKAWVNNLALFISYRLPPKGYVVFPGGEEHPNIVYPNRKEFLFDIHVCRYRRFKSIAKNEKYNYVDESYLVLESEFAKNTKQAVEDLSKLLCSNAKIKVFVGPYYDLGNKSDYFKTILQVALRNKIGTLYIALVPHPKQISKGESNWMLFKIKRGNYKQI